MEEARGRGSYYSLQLWPISRVSGPRQQNSTESQSGRGKKSTTRRTRRERKQSQQLSQMKRAGRVEVEDDVEDDEHTTTK